MWPRTAPLPLTDYYDYVYALFTLQTKEKPEKDQFAFFYARTMDAKPVRFVADRLTGEFECSAGKEGVKFELGKRKMNAELAIPRKLLGLDKDASSFFGNFARVMVVTVKGRRGNEKKEKIVHYWRGNQYSLENPVVYAQFKLED
ncbi:MAG: hypothetical protein U5N86_10820 [Planctomycetota bacterium]|nr:hypothetical protein [Planctomycetota bacterium]